MQIAVRVYLQMEYLELGLFATRRGWLETRDLFKLPDAIML